MENILSALISALFFILLAGLAILPAALAHRRLLREQQDLTPPGGPPAESALPPLSLKAWCKRLGLIFCAVFAFCSLQAIGETSDFSPTGNSSRSLLCGVMISLAFIFCLPVMLFSLVALASPRKRRMAATLLLACAMFFICTTFWDWVGEGIRDRALLAFTERSKPLVSAIEAYRKDLGKPPASLKELVPAYLAAIPKTGLGACPEYSYQVENANGLEWELSIAPDPFHFSSAMIYDPLIQVRSYNEGSMRYGDWIYTW